MTDAEFEAQKARIEKLIDYWPAMLGLQSWRLTYDFERDSGAFIETTGGEGTAWTKAEWPYSLARIVFNMPLIGGLDDSFLEHVFVHELMHIFLKEMRLTQPQPKDEALSSLAADHEERVADNLAHAFIWTRDESRGVKA